MLRLAEELKLPIDAATRRLAILAMSGAGKSNVAVVLAEQMFDAGIPWVAIDPKGDWWGVRSSKSGKGPGLPIPIFGGLHADVPIDPTAAAGTELAEVIVAQRLTCVVDISEFTNRQDMWAFLAAFGERLLLRNRQVLHLFLEEADEYLPQKTSEKGNLPKCLGVWQRVVKRGRFRGLGSTQITQRNASLNKDTLYQAEALFALRATGKGDRDAVKGWVEHHNAAEEIVASLPTLADGEGWMSSPAWLRKTVRVQFERRRTFDSGSTPVLLEPNAKPATLADVDLSALRTKMAAAIEKAKADDPLELRKQIAELQRQLKSKSMTSSHIPEKKPPKIVEKPVITDAQIARLESLVGKVDSAVTRAGDVLAKPIAALMTPLQELVTAVKAVRQPVLPLAPARPMSIAADGPAPAPRPPREVRPVDGVSPVMQRILDALAELELLGARQPARELVAMLSGYSHLNSKGFVNALGALRTAGYVDYPSQGNVALSEAGRGVAVAPEAPRTATEVQDRIIALLGGASGKILRPLITAYPNAVAREEVAAQAGYGHLNSKGFVNALGRLRTLGFVDYPERGTVKAQPVLFLEA